ncbi:hypothetical protein LCGC14_0580660 [marine sediment metagenome]|uniref:Uncharacterized protein n=1 Tax=marine sediment metagenome TaxID=412755 RepID=A0A0F9RLG4_9ZZZZ
MTFELLAVVLITVLVLAGGAAGGAYLYRAGHQSGVKLVDRLKHDQVPFIDDVDEAEVQTFTDGSYEKVEEL